jgi:hypothetical protein
MEAAKRANLAFQTWVQARALLDHHQPEPVLARLEQVTAEGEVEEMVEAAIPPGYVQRTVRAMNPDRAVLGEWSGELFRRRISFWPVLGIIAWPVAALGMVLSGIRSMFSLSPWSHKAQPGEPWHAGVFDADGIALADRVDAVMVATRRRLGQVPAPLLADLPDADAMEFQIKSQVLALAETFRTEALAPLLARRPGLFGRLFRRGLALLILLWFPFVQPVLRLVLGAFGSVADWDWRVAGELAVEALSASAVLSGLLVSLLLLACITAAVYSIAVRDANALLQRVSGAGESAGGVCASLASAIRRPLEHARERLGGVTEQLVRMAA